MEFEPAFGALCIFFKCSTRLRYVERRPRLHAKELRWSLDDFAVLAKYADCPAIAERSYAILVEFSERYACAREMLAEVDAYFAD